ncbi:hypothetical protein OKN36_20500 [Furfurilactobacillus sp. OKN36]
MNVKEMIPKISMGKEKSNAFPIDAKDAKSSLSVESKMNLFWAELEPISIIINTSVGK